LLKEGFWMGSEYHRPNIRIVPADKVRPNQYKRVLRLCINKPLRFTNLTDN
jgi:hypothetical protein